MKRWTTLLPIISVASTFYFSPIAFAEDKLSLTTNFTIETLNKTTNSFIEKVKKFNDIYIEKKNLEVVIEKNLKQLESLYLDASKYPTPSSIPTFTEYKINLNKWKSNLELSRKFNPISANSTLSLTQSFKQLDDYSYNNYASKPPILSSERIRITGVEFPTKPIGPQVSYFRLFITSKYFVYNLKVNVNFGGNFTGGGVGFSCCAIYPGTPIVVNTNPTQFVNMVESVRNVNDEYKYQVLVPLVIADKSLNIDTFFRMADTASFVVGDSSRNIYACPWWFARNGSPTATNPNDPWVKSQIFAFFSNDVSCAESPNSRYVLWQDSFESNLLRHTDAGDFESLLSAYREYSKYEQSVNLIPDNFNDLSSLVDNLGADLKAQISSSSEIMLFIKQAAAKAATVKSKTITCIKSKLTKKVTGINPKCPAGYKQK